jgi:hypothetical protein
MKKLVAFKNATLPGLRMHHAVVPQSSCATAYIERIIFAGKNRNNHQLSFLGDPA